MVPASSSVAQNSKHRQPSVFASGAAIVAYMALARMIVYFFSATHYGYFRDELYYLACGEHPAWGYVDQPPLIAWVAWLLQHTIGTSLWALRLLPALADCGAIALAGLLARELGGGRWAIFLAALSCLMAPVAMALSNLFTMNAFDPLLWTVIAYLLVRIAKTGNEKLWIPIGALAGVAILNKYGVVFWLAGVLVGICLTPLRASLRRGWFWIGMALAIIIPLPNFFWQWHRQFPFLQLMHNIRQTNRDIRLSPPAYLLDQAHMLGFASAVLVVLALVFFFSRRGRDVRVLGWAYLVFLGLLIALHGKGYYVAPVYPMMFAAGAVWMESATRKRAWYWTKPALAFMIVAIGAVILPTIVPVLSVPQFLAYEKKTGIGQQKFEHSAQGVLPQLYADMFGWREMAERVAAFYNTLPPDQRAKTAIFANNYGDAGAIDFFGPALGLPKSIGGHQSYWFWGPRNYTGESVIVLGERHESRIKELCTQGYSIIGTTEYPLSRPEEWHPIYYCRGVKPDFQTGWPEFKHWD
jgi:hypothetical protein